MKEANMKRLYTIWFKVYDILEKAQTMETVKS